MQQTRGPMKSELDENPHELHAAWSVPIGFLGAGAGETGICAVSLVELELEL